MKSIDQSGWIAPRRILGMKIWQAALLGGLGIMDCLVLVAGLAIVLGPSLSGFSLAAALPPTATPPLVTTGPTLTPTLTETPLTMVFQFPTYTPFGTPADTPTPTPGPESLMDGWVKFTVPKVEIWMPGTYAAGDPHTDAAAIVASLQQMGADYNWSVIEEQLRTSAQNYVLWGIDSHQGNPAVVTFVAIAYDFPNSGELLADYATRFVGAISDSFVLIEQKSIRHPEYEVQRVLLETKDSQGTPMRVALYAMRDGNIIWDALCFTAVDEMDARLPSFDQMVTTFRALAKP
jgi:hypothetical protein